MVMVAMGTEVGKVRRMLRRIFALAALSLPLALTACDGSSAPPMTPDQLVLRDRVAVDRVLQGSTWRIASWRPDSQLEAMLQQLLYQQLATMTVRFANGRILADSPTLHVERAYAVTDAAGSQFTLVATDQNGVSLKTVAQLSDDGSRVDFKGETDPWRGTGQLVRAQ
jgi:hypothetical protein